MKDESTQAQTENTLTNGVNFLGEWINNHADILIQYGVNIVSAILILFIGNMVAKWVSNSVANALNKRKLDKAVVEFIRGIIRYTLLAIVLMAALSRVGIQTASVIAILGAAGLAIGLALQGSLANFASGVLIVVFRPFKSGDYVEVDGVAGDVEAIQIYQTILKTPDSKKVIVPNSKVIGSHIVNYSSYSKRRIDIVIKVPYKVDLEHAKSVLRETLEKDKRILTTPKANIAVRKLDDYSVNIVVRPWCKTSEYWDIYDELLQNLKEDLEKSGIEIPCPAMSVDFKNITKIE